MKVSAISLLGVPGAGKGTIAAGVEAKTDYVHISTGNLLRDAVNRKTPMGARAESYMNRGDLVPDDVILSVVMERIDRGAESSKYMFDGFPRTLEQARLLEALFDEREAVLSCVFLLEVPREVALDRLGGRRICGNCGANFHIRNIPPREAGVCDHCGGELYRRPDDSEATIMNRLDVFHAQSEGLVSHYENRGILTRIDSSRPWRKVVDGIADMLREPAGTSAFAAADWSRIIRDHNQERR